MKLTKYFKIWINCFLKIFKMQLNRITLSNNFFYHIEKTLKIYKINLVLDIGANQGQFAEKLIQYGYNKKIVSFEPIKYIHNKLLNKSKNYNNWQIYKKCAFGKSKGFKFLNISENTVSSSFMDINKAHIKVEPRARYTRKEKINLITLNDYFKKKQFKNKNIFIKIDTQGYEKNIILGGAKILKNITGVMLEVSIIKVYKKEETYLGMIALMEKMGFTVWSIERGFTNKKTGQVLQMDIIFINKNVLQSI